MTIQPKAMAGDIPVYCSHDDVLEIEKLVKNPRNPNIHPESQIEALGKIICAQGWRQPVTVSNRSGFIVKGHGRLDAAIKRGLEYVPVDYQDYATEAEEWADMIADNRIAELSGMDNDLISEIISEISDADIDLELTGFDLESLDGLLSVNGTESFSIENEEENRNDTETVETESNNYQEQYGVIVICKNESEQEKVYTFLCEQGYECKVVAT